SWNPHLKALVAKGRHEIELIRGTLTPLWDTFRRLKKKAVAALRNHIASICGYGVETWGHTLVQKGVKNALDSVDTYLDKVICGLPRTANKHVPKLLLGDYVSTYERLLSRYVVKRLHCPAFREIKYAGLPESWWRKAVGELPQEGAYESNGTLHSYGLEKDFIFLGDGAERTEELPIEYQKRCIIYTDGSLDPRKTTETPLGYGGAGAAGVRTCDSSALMVSVPNHCDIQQCEIIAIR
ncbi:hypothetical protein FOZ63_018494, partial [Perkinsus olseni]